MIVFVPWFTSALAAPTISACSNDDAPNGFEDDDCDNVCTFSGNRVTCDIDKGNGTYFPPHQITMVTDFAFTGDRVFSIWGIAREVGEFCCFVEDRNNEVSYLKSVGTNHSTGDTIRANHPSSGNNVFGVVSELYGDAGPDEIHGSNVDTQVSSTDEFIYGGTEGDTIYGNAGEDDIEGNGGADTIECGPGDDDAHGGTGSDTIYGNEGEDLLFGEGNGDFIYGGDNDDVIYGDDGNGGSDGDDLIEGGPGADGLAGGEGADTLCAGAGNGDNLQGNAGADILWVPTTASNPTGSTNTTVDTCGHTVHGSSWAGLCLYTLTTKPAACQ